MTSASYYGILIWNIFFPFTAIALHQKTWKEWKENQALGETSLGNAHFFIRLQIDHPDRALQKI